MALLSDLTAYLMQGSGPRTVRYGDAHRYDGQDLPAPSALVVPTRYGPVRCEVYDGRHHDGRAHDGPVGVYVHLHGGAFIVRHPAMDDFFCRHVAARCGAVVINVDYDTAPQVRYPVAQHQAHDVGAWVSEHAAELGADPALVAVGGFSAGGSLAASAALQARDSGAWSPVLQLLGVPSLDVAEPVAHKLSSSASPMVSARLLRLVRATYFADVRRRSEPYASPGLAEDLRGLAPTYLITAEHDALRDEGDRYAARLVGAGVPVQHSVVPGADHYFLDGPSVTGRVLMDRMSDALRGAYDRAAERD